MELNGKKILEVVEKDADETAMLLDDGTIIVMYNYIVVGGSDWAEFWKNYKS